MNNNITIALIKCFFVLTFVFDSTIINSQCNHPDDIAGLTAIYTALGGSSWNFNNNSNTADDWIPNCNGCDLSQWNGITCENGRVSSINLGNPVTPQNIGVNGDFPNISVSMSGVKLINLANEEVSALPINIGSMFPNLEYLDLISNDLSGTIPNSISNLSKLTFLDLGNNQLTGNMPDFSGCNLNVLSLANNLLKGSITLNFLNSTVNYFGMQQNPTANFNNNNFSDFLPDEYGIINPAINVEIVLVFEGNQIDGPIPSSYSQDDRLRISIRFNEMTGCFPDALRNHPDLPINSTNSPTVFTPNIEEGNCFDASWFEFINNNLAACNSNYVCSDPGYESWNAESLIAFYNATNGSQWTNNEGWAEGAAGESCNPCCWFGITCEYPNILEYTYGTIVGIELPNNNINGPLTTDLSNIETLKKLNLFGNKLSGKFPGEYGDLQNLTLINVANNNLIGCYDPNLSNLCPISSNSTISDNNNFDEQWSSFCFNGKGECDDSDPCEDNTVISFDGTDDWIQASSPLNGDTDYTISIDFKGGVQSNGTYPRLLGFTSFETEIAVKGTTLSYYNGATWQDSPEVVADNIWHNVTLIRENAENRLYLDGLLLSSLAAPANLNFIGSVSVGSTSNGSGEFFNGLIDNVNIWDIALSNEQVCDNINSGGSPNVLNFDFEEGQGNANNATISGPADLAGGDNNGTFAGLSLTGDKSNYICEDYSLSCDIDPCDNDTTPPIVACPPVNASTLSINSSQTLGIGLSTFNISATDDCRVRYDFSPNVLTCDELGDNVVIATVTDEAGNSSSCTILFVLDDPSNYCEKSCVNNTVMHFDGVNDKVVASSPLTGNSNYTISIDFKCGPQSNGAYPRLVAFTSFETEIAVKGTELAYYNGSSWIDSGINVADNACHNVTLTRSNNQNTLYLDGGKVSVLPGPSTLAFGGQVNIGGQDAGTNEFFGGTIDNVRIWSTALDSADVCVLNTLVPDALHYDFEEGNGDNNNTGIAGPTDLILNGVNGSFSGFSLDGTSSNYICDDVCDVIKPCFNIPMECNQMCMTDVVDLSTGVDFNDGSLLPIGQYDGGWVMVSGPDTDLNYPQPGFVLTPNSAWSGQLDAQYISPFANTSNNNSFPIAYTFERQFCICEETKVTLEVSALFDNFIDIGLYDDSGNLIEQLINVQSNSTNNFQVPSNSSTCHDLIPGIYNLRAGLRNDANVSMGMAIEASLTGAGLIESGCCSPYQYVTGTVFEDTGCDGVYNTSSDPTFSDIVVSLCDQSGMVLQQSTTDAFGFYTFFDVTPGEYLIKQDEISGLDLTLGNGGYSIDVMPNTVTSNLDFGNCKDPCANDTTPPDLSCPMVPTTILLEEDGTAALHTGLFGWQVTDNCGTVTIETDVEQTNCDNVGLTLITILTVTDEAGNISTCEMEYITTDPNEFCNDPTCIFTCTEECSADNVNLSTGINSTDGSFLSIGDYDANWTLISSPDPGIQVPRPAFVLNPNPVWDNLSGSQYISAYPDAVNNANNISDGTYYEFEKCFCVCDDMNEVQISLAAYVDNNLDILLFDSNGNQVQSLLSITDITAGAFTGDPEETETTLNLENGVYCMRARLKNDGGQTMGMSIEAKIAGVGLIENQCCKTYNAITGIVFDDMGCDGSNTLGADVGISNWDLQLCTSSGSVEQTLTTDAFGYFSFNNIAPGEYIAKALNPNSNISSTEIEVPITIGLNEVIPIDFGFCNIGTSISEVNNFDNEVTVYPIPFTESLIIEIAREHSGYECQIINSVGQALQSFDIDINLKRYNLNVNDMPSGIYYITFINKLDYSQASKRIIKL